MLSYETSEYALILIKYNVSYILSVFNIQCNRCAWGYLWYFYLWSNPWQLILFLFIYKNTDDPSLDYYRELTEERKIGYDEEDLKLIETLNAEQSYGFNEILAHVVNKKGNVFFVDGPGGTSKTYLYKALLAKVRSLGEIAIATGTYGIAASSQEVEQLTLGSKYP